VAFVTIVEARAASRAAWGTKSFAETEIRKAAGVSIDTKFDVFISHSFRDAEIISGVKKSLSEMA
jgi:hypothetical protein